MRELYIGRTEETGEEGPTYRFDYYILVDQLEFKAGLFCESYGIKVISPDTQEAEVIPNITVSASRIDQLAELMMRNGVTPATARDVVLDWL